MFKQMLIIISVRVFWLFINVWQETFGFFFLWRAGVFEAFDLRQATARTFSLPEKFQKKFKKLDRNPKKVQQATYLYKPNVQLGIPHHKLPFYMIIGESSLNFAFESFFNK